MKLEGKVAIVTGGGRGIGQGIVHCLAEERVDVAVVDLDGDNAKTVAGEVKALGRKSLGIQADITDSKQVAKVVQDTADTFGKIDILVNNVGGGAARSRTGAALPRATRFIDIDEETWDKTFELNTKTQFLMCRAVVPYFIKQKSGKIVNIGSWLGQKPGNPQLFAYSVAKAASIHFTKMLAIELAEYNINVNCVCPGDVLTPAIERGFQMRIQSNPELAGKTPRDLFTELIKSRTPLKRLQSPEDMGHAVVFLVSEDARNITGHILNVDGGQIM